MNHNKRRSQLGSAGFASNDRLSYLPDAIIDHIMSFLDTKTAVQTSILSSRWKCVWKRVPALILNHHSFGRWYSRFAIFVDKVLSLRYPLKLNKIIYSSGYSEEESKSKDVYQDICDPLVARVIKYAVSHGASHLMLDLSDHVYTVGSYRFSESCALISECDLKTLSLRCFQIDYRFGSFGFRALTKLELVDCAFLPDLQLVVDPFSKFPCLKNLVLDNFYMLYGAKHKRFRISGPQLHNLEISDRAIEGVEISAPNLKSFKQYNLQRSMRFSKLDLPSLDCADIHCSNNASIAKEDWDFLFQGCHNVKSLTLCDSTMKALCDISEFLEHRPSPFTRLKNLNLKVCRMSIPYKVMRYFFDGSSCAAPSINMM